MFFFLFVLMSFFSFFFLQKKKKMAKSKKRKEKAKRSEGEIFGGPVRAFIFSFPEEFHHPSVVLRLLGQLLRPGHLHHLPEQVEGQV